jgi:hypothetical protein
MKKVFYKGVPYEFTVRKTNSQRIFSLYTDSAVVREVAERDLDTKSVVSLILEDYYTELTQQDAMKPAF